MSWSLRQTRRGSLLSFHVVLIKVNDKDTSGVNFCLTK